MNLLKRSIIPAAGLLAIALSGAAQEAAITSGDVTLNVNRADDGTFYISYAAYGEELNGDAESNPALFIDTLSAPLPSNLSTSLTLLIPPPTVNGMLTLSATRRTRSMNVFRPSYDAVMSR